MHDNVSQMTRADIARFYEHLAQRNQHIIEMYRAGASFPAIAKAFDVAPSTARLIVRHYAKTRLANNRLSDNDTRSIPRF